MPGARGPGDLDVYADTSGAAAGQEKTRHARTRQGPANCTPASARALADPERLLIINEPRDGPRPAGDIADALGVSQPNVSRHLAILRDRGFVTTQRFGSSIHYALASPKILRALDLLR